MRLDAPMWMVLPLSILRPPTSLPYGSKPGNGDVFVTCDTHISTWRICMSGLASMPNDHFLHVWTNIFPQYAENSHWRASAVFFRNHNQLKETLEKTCVNSICRHGDDHSLFINILMSKPIKTSQNNVIYIITSACNVIKYNHIHYITQCHHKCVYMW